MNEILIIIISIEIVLKFIFYNKKINLNILFFEENSLIVFFVYVLFSVFLLKLASSYNIIIYYFAFKFCTVLISFFPKNILVNYYFDFFSEKVDLKKYQYNFLYKINSNIFLKQMLVLILFIICFYASYFVVFFYLFNFLNLHSKFDNAIKGFFDFKDQLIYLTPSGLLKIKKYKLNIICDNAIEINQLKLIFEEDFIFKDKNFNKMFINGYL